MATTNEILIEGFTQIVEKLSQIHTDLVSFYTNLKKDLTFLYTNLHNDLVQLSEKMDTKLEYDIISRDIELIENELLKTRHTDAIIMYENINRLVKTLRGERDYNNGE